MNMLSHKKKRKNLLITRNGFLFTAILDPLILPALV